MRETKEQKMTRLERVVDEQKKELIELRKERKSLNYKVGSLEKEKAKLVGDKDELKKEIKNLKRNNQLIDNLKKEINDIQTKLDNADEQNEMLQSKYRVEKAAHDDDIERYGKQIERLRMRINQLEKQGIGDVRKAMQGIADIKSDSMIDNITLQQFASGSMYYDNTLFNLANYVGGANIDEDNLLEKCKTGRKPFFDVEDLIIRVNPKTGVELSDDAINYIKTILNDEVEYDMALLELGDYGCLHDGKELDAFAYSKGMALLELYEDKVF